MLKKMLTYFHFDTHQSSKTLNSAPVPPLSGSRTPFDTSRGVAREGEEKGLESAIHHFCLRCFFFP